MIYAVNKRTKEHRLDNGLKTDDEVWVEADPDGWIEWHASSGAKSPVANRNGYGLAVMRLAHGGEVDAVGHWDDTPLPKCRVVAYRPILDADTKPEAPAWDGEGDKPPVGSRCMKDHAEVLVIAHANVGSLYDPAVVYQPINHPMGIDWKVSNVFSPIRSEEDRFVDEVNELMEAEELFSLDRHARALYRVGYRKTGDT